MCICGYRLTDLIFIVVTKCQKLVILLPQIIISTVNIYSGVSIIKIKTSNTSKHQLQKV